MLTIVVAPKDGIVEIDEVSDDVLLLLLRNLSMEDCVVLNWVKVGDVEKHNGRART